ncbi:MAG: T9SS type A sorting domain-containing protein [Thermoanaerobaculia bacterium]|nr:T9SS type A sorting domain-containing protein [Thermoanaerobaculia bacterium]
MKNYIIVLAAFLGCMVSTATWAQTPTDPVPTDPEGVYITAVHPNPATERIMIEFNATVLGDEVMLRIRNSEGKTILKRTLITVEGGNAVILLVQSLPVGEYVVQLDEGRQVRSARWQKM